MKPCAELVCYWTSWIYTVYNLSCTIFKILVSPTTNVGGTCSSVSPVNSFVHNSSGISAILKMN